MRRRDTWLLLAAAAFAATAAAAEIKITGQVIAEDGTPIAGAAAALLPARAAYQTGIEELAGRPPAPAAAGATAEDGRFELTVPEPWVWGVRLEAPGFVPMVGWIWDPVVEELALPPATLRRDEGLEVVVRDAAGRPAFGAMVFAKTRSDELWADRPPPGSPTSWSRDRSRGSTDERGRTVLHRAAGESLDVYAVARGSAPARPPRTSGEPVELRLRRVAPAPIEVVDARGLPVPGALVTLGSFR